MSPQELMNKLEAIVDDAKAAVLTTTGPDGRPHARWMTPAILKWRGLVCYALTRPGTQKLADIAAQPEVEWMFQTRSLGQVVHVRGRVNVLDHPGLKNELLEELGPRLAVFWKVDLEQTEFVALETVIEQAVYFQPMRGHRETVSFRTQP